MASKFQRPYGLTARWLQIIGSFEYENIHRSTKSIGHADSTSMIPSQDGTVDQAHASTSSAEAKHPTQFNDETSDTEWRYRPRTDKGKAPVTRQKGHTVSKEQQ